MVSFFGKRRKKQEGGQLLDRARGKPEGTHAHRVTHQQNGGTRGITLSRLKRRGNLIGKGEGTNKKRREETRKETFGL